jgi:hypothetical protein
MRSPDSCIVLPGAPLARKTGVMMHFFRIRRGRTAVAAAAAAAGVAAAALLVSPGTAGALPGSSGANFTPPKIGHVWTIILENKSYEATFTGLNQNSYLWKTLPSYGELLRQYYGTGHFSLDNYVSAVSGQSPAPDNQADCPRYVNVSPGSAAPDDQTLASTIRTTAGTSSRWTASTPPPATPRSRRSPTTSSRSRRPRRSPGSRRTTARTRTTRPARATT